MSLRMWFSLVAVIICSTAAEAQQPGNDDTSALTAAMSTILTAKQSGIRALPANVSNTIEDLSLEVAAIYGHAGGLRDDLLFQAGLAAGIFARDAKSKQNRLDALEVAIKAINAQAAVRPNYSAEEPTAKDKFEFPMPAGLGVDRRIGFVRTELRFAAVVVAPPVKVSDSGFNWNNLGLDGTPPPSPGGVEKYKKLVDDLKEKAGVK